MDKPIHMDFQPDLRSTKWMKGWRDMPEAYIRIKTPGVTTVINDMIPNPDYENFVKEVGQEAADRITQAANWRGSAMHLFIELFLQEMKISGDPSKALRETQIKAPPILLEEKVPQHKIEEGMKLFYKFYESDYVSDYSELVGTETDIYDPYYFYRGKIDWLFKIAPHGLGVRDFKSSSKPIEPGSRKEEGYKFQLGAYAGAVEHMYKKNKNDVKINYASIVTILTKSEIVQNIELFGKELDMYKRKYAELAKQWHIDHGQGFLFNQK